MGNYNPSDIRKIIVQVFGICLAISGVILIVHGSKIDGTSITLKFNKADSKLETATAGVYLLFLSFWLVLLPSLSFKVPAAGNSSKLLDKPVIRFILGLTAISVLVFALNYVQVSYGFIAIIIGLSIGPLLRITSSNDDADE